MLLGRARRLPARFWNSVGGKCLRRIGRGASDWGKTAKAGRDSLIVGLLQRNSNTFNALPKVLSAHGLDRNFRLDPSALVAYAGLWQPCLLWSPPAPRSLSYIGSAALSVLNCRWTKCSEKLLD